MKKIFYWSPCLNRVGTLYSTINSAISIKKYSRGNFEPIIINSCGEWDNYSKIFKDNNIKIINFYKINFFKHLPKKGFIGSRFSYFIIFVFSFLPLLRLTIKNKSDILIAHLITSLPLTLASIFNIKIKLILRISGYPKLNFSRYWFWKFCSRKISYVTCPTISTLEKINSINLFPKNKIVYLQDAIINIDKLKSQSTINKEVEKYILAVGRLTKQKNFLYLLEEFEQFLKISKKYKLIILGDGDQKKDLQNFCKLKNIANNVEFKGEVDNVYYYMKSAEIFVLSSLWEDPGFVIIEAGFSNLFVISSDCPNGPKEFLKNSNAGILFKSNTKNGLTNSLIKFENTSHNEKMKKKIALKKTAKKYSIFRHYKVLKDILIKLD
tara:strand:+ start:476 stop:1618 length:1143 start_codon:yes stop_codon:yes gene_type:complete